jgi:hypothetical protein
MRRAFNLEADEPQEPQKGPKLLLEVDLKW